MSGEKAWSVSELNRYIRGLFSDDFMLSDMSVKGELSNVKYHSSGHIYFTLKDENSAISCVMFASDTLSLDFRLEAGDKVIIRGRVSVYEKTGTYQLYVRSVKAAGIGELYRKFEELKKELSEMGMFDAMYKKPIPLMAGKIGVVTAPTGAAVRDIINVSKRRNPYVELILFPAQVQGEGAAESVSLGIRTLEKMEPDVIIVGRGGGSIEDLWAFNEEIVARTIFDCHIPVISGTGHETDVTIADLVADLRAPTPSAAAELAVFDYYSFMETLKGYGDKMTYLMNGRIGRCREEAERMGSILRMNSPENRLKLKREMALRYGGVLRSSMDRILKEKRSLLALYSGKLSAYSPLNTLSRGYTFTERADGKPVKSTTDVNEGEDIRVYTKDGRILARVNGKEEIRFS